MSKFQIISDFSPCGDQPEAIASLVKGLNQQKKNQVLLGVTGSGKTFTMAHVIERTQRPAMILAHNKTLAAQLYSEMRQFFPNNAVEYFVSYYDYYQPEAYVPKSDTFIEKDASINEQIDRLRHSATRAMLERRDVIVVASVSCIYGIGSAETYAEMTLNIKRGDTIHQHEFLGQLISLLYTRNDLNFVRGTFRVRGDTIDLFPAHLEDRAWRFSLFGDEIDSITEFDPLTGEKTGTMDEVRIYANSHYVTPKPTIDAAIKNIKLELKERLDWFYQNNKLLEAQRLEQRTNFDLEMLIETDLAAALKIIPATLLALLRGEPPPTLFSYLPDDAILFVDESHVMLPQLRAMYNGDKSRKSVLSEYGFRLPSCLDNRPLKYEEWDAKRPQTIFVSATPSQAELEMSGGEFVEQIIRPTGLIDPVCIIRPVESQVDDLIHECKKLTAKNQRALVTTLTKKMAEKLCEYLEEVGVKTRYLHSDIDTLERVEILRDLRLGIFDVLIGVNLLREGLDIPECGLVAILDADKEGFLRSRTSLIQTIGRAARNVDSYVLLYADKMTDSLKAALEETERRRTIQITHNEKHGITPTSIKKAITDHLKSEESTAKNKRENSSEEENLSPENQENLLTHLREKMLQAASNLEFEEAARLRDKIDALQQQSNTPARTKSRK